MALPTKKIPELTAYGASLQGSEMLEIWAAGTSRRITARDFVLPNVDSIITAVNQVAVLPKSRFIAAGTGIAIADGGAGGALTISMLGTGALPGNPTAQVSTTPVNGVANTWMRSDAAPQIDQAMQPTWSQQHIFSALVAANIGPINLASANPGILLNETDAAAANRLWDMVASSEQFRLRLKSDDGVTTLNFFTADRTGVTCDNITLRADAGTVSVISSSVTATFGASGVTAIAGITTTGQYLVTDTNPSYYIQETDAPADEKIWRLNAVAGDLVWSTRTDVNGGGATFLTVARTGTTVDLIALAATSITLNSIAITDFARLSQDNTFTSSGKPLQMSSASPRILWNETDAAVDNRLWFITANGEQFVAATRNDADSSGANFMVIDRTGTVVDSVVFTTSGETLTIGASSVTSSGSVITNGGFNASSAQPISRWIETDAPANEQIYDVTSVAGDMFWRTRTDVDGAGVSFIAISRTGTTVDSYTFQNITTVAVNTAMTVSGNVTHTVAQSGPTAYPLLMSSATPALAFNETDAAANNRLWDIIANGEQWVRRVLSDAGAAVNFEVIDRTANVVDQIQWTASQFVFSGPIQSAKMRAMREAYNAVTWNAGANTLDLDVGNLHRILLQGNVTLSFSNPPSNSTQGVTITIFLLQDGTGSRTVTWPASVHWDSGTTPVLTTTANRIDAVTLTTFDGGTTYYGGQVLANVVP